jgi:hypothetical protein
VSVQPIWNRLQAVTELTFTAQSQAEMNTGWNGTGTGQVEVEMTGPLELLFHEKGSFALPSGRTSRFHNTYRWTASDDGQSIRLEHLRFGAESPVYLFTMAPQADGTFHSVEPHLCRDDCYAAKMSFDDEFIRLTWTVSGPAKAEMISYVYR